MSTLFFIYGLKSKIKNDFSPYIKNNVLIMGSHIVSPMKAHDLLKLA